MCLLRCGNRRPQCRCSMKIHSFNEEYFKPQSNKNCCIVCCKCCVHPCCKKKKPHPVVPTQINFEQDLYNGPDREVEGLDYDSCRCSG